MGESMDPLFTYLNDQRRKILIKDADIAHLCMVPAFVILMPFLTALGKSVWGGGDMHWLLKFMLQHGVISAIVFVLVLAPTMYSVWWSVARSDRVHEDKLATEERLLAIFESSERVGEVETKHKRRARWRKAIESAILVEFAFCLLVL